MQNAPRILHNGRAYRRCSARARGAHRITAPMRNACLRFRAEPDTSHQARPLYEMHVLLLGYRPALKKNLNFVFLFIRKGYKVFSPLRYENDLFIRGKRIQ